MKRNGIKQIHGLGTIKNIKDLRDKVNRAKNNPTELTNLLCKDFNITGFISCWSGKASCHSGN